MIVMPTTTPLMSQQDQKLWGRSGTHGDVFDEALAHANRLAAEKGYTFIHPLMIWMLPQVGNDRDGDYQRAAHGRLYSVVPIGGGSLCTGVATLAKASESED